MERRQGMLQHELVGRRERADEDEREVDRRLRENHVWWQRVDLACGQCPSPPYPSYPALPPLAQRGGTSSTGIVGGQRQLTSPAPDLLPHALLKRLLLLQIRQPAHTRPAGSGSQVRYEPRTGRGLVWRGVVLGQHPVAVRVEDEQRRDRVEREI